MNIDYKVGEVELTYKPQFKNLYKVVSSEDAYKVLLPTYKEVQSVTRNILRSCSSTKPTKF